MSDIPLSVRISEDVKNNFDNYCKSHGLKKGFFLNQIIKEKLEELLEDEMDYALADERYSSMNKDEMVSFNDINEMLDKRLKCE
jgi:predicted DNA-binding protein